MQKPAPTPTSLRAAAEARLVRAPAAAPSCPAEEALHELQVHQIELEMQNEALRQAQIDLEASRDRYVDLYEFAPVGYLSLTEAGLIAGVNLTGATLLGVERKSLIDRRFASLVTHEDSDSWYRHFLRALREDERSSCEVELRRGDGITSHARLDMLRVPGEDSMVRVALTDISERQWAERAQAAADAARMAALAEAERLAGLKNAFLANMSHEIRTPLNGVLNLALIGRRDSAAGSEAHATFSRIHEVGRHLLAVVNDILDFSRIEACKLSVERVAFDLDTLIDDAAELATEKARDKGLGFRLRKAADLPAGCLGDPLRLTQVLVNLLDNAVKFTDRGEVGLSVGRAGGQLLFEVADTGIGMSAAQIGRLFDAFEQADGSTTRRFGGTGLGMAISKRLVDLMGGTLGADSTVGGGTRFELRLPLTETAPPVIETAPATGPRLAGLALLAAEDDAVNRLVLEELLGNEGAQLTCVDHGLLAVERVERDGAGAWDLVLMDIQMPVMDGHTATRRLREIAPDLPIVGLTAHALEEERDRCLASGMAAHATKPIELDKLVATILRHARRRKDACPSAGD